VRGDARVHVRQHRAESLVGDMPKPIDVVQAQRYRQAPDELDRPWPPNEANVLEPATWRLEFLVCGDNIRPGRSFVILSFDGTRPQPESSAIWRHFLVHGPSPEILHPSEDATRLPELSRTPAIERR